MITVPSKIGDKLLTGYKNPGLLRACRSPRPPESPSIVAP